jgi:hypothetical protein
MLALADAGSKALSNSGVDASTDGEIFRRKRPQS